MFLLRIARQDQISDGDNREAGPVARKSPAVQYWAAGQWLLELGEVFLSEQAAKQHSGKASERSSQQLLLHQEPISLVWVAIASCAGGVLPHGAHLQRQSLLVTHY
jgi:hypothetical protein